MRLTTASRAVLCLAAALVLTPAAFAAAPGGELCQDRSQNTTEALLGAPENAPVLDLDPTADSFPAAYNCVYSGTEHCIDTHETTPCWTIRFQWPACPTASGTCVTNIQYHTYDLYWCS